MRASKTTARKATGCSELVSGAVARHFRGAVAKELLATVPGASNPSEAILWYAGLLVIESGMNQPPFRPQDYATLRRVRGILDKEMNVEGRLVPVGRDFLIELRRDRSQQRKNFTCAHELAHTFFHEALPQIKNNATRVGQPQLDCEEEMLCNIAAAELLMPMGVFSRIARDFNPSPKALTELAKLFDVSLAAMALRVANVGLWDCSFILWSKKDALVGPRWLVRRTARFTHSPKLRISDPKSSGICHTFQTGETTSSTEWLYLDDRAKLCRVISMRLSESRIVLSCILNGSGSEDKSSNQRPADPRSLPLTHVCECDGTGWRIYPRDGRTYALRCRAPIHANRVNTH